MSTHEHGKTTRHIACTHVVPGCGFTANAETEEALIEQVVAHAKEVHGITEVTPDLAEKVKAAIVHK